MARGRSLLDFMSITCMFNLQIMFHSDLNVAM
jgi:hypothetical protein